MEDKKEKLQKLTEEELVRRDRGFKAKEFLECEFFMKYLLPAIEKNRLGAYPDPNEDGWENKYRLSFAKDTVYTELLQMIHSWFKEYEALHKKESTPVKDIINS